MNMKIIDRRNQAMGGQNDTRKRSQITAIAWHYTAVARNNRAFITSHESYWKNTHGWKRGGYHFYIDADGNIYQNYNYETVSNGVGGNNSYLVNICVEANSASDYSQAQVEAREWLTRKVMQDLNIPASRVFGHKELPNQSTSCPGYSKEQMNEFRRKLQGGDNPNKTEPVVSSDKSIDTLANEVIKGIHGQGDARKKSLGNQYDAVQKRVNEILSGKVTPVAKPTPKPVAKTIDQLANDVINGKLGSGDARKKALGSQYDAVQKRVNELLGAKTVAKAPAKTIQQLVDETLAGKHGNGDARKKSLGSNYNAVMSVINKKSTPSKSIDTIAREVIAGKFGNGADRQKNVEKAGYNYNVVQKRVNEILK